MQCINCKNEINLGGMVCPYCHTIPFSFGSQPYSGVDPALYSGPGLFDGLAEGIGNLFSKIGRWRRNETSYVDFVFGHTGTVNGVPGEPVYRRRCCNCEAINWPQATMCDGCKKSFVN